MKLSPIAAAVSLVFALSAHAGVTIVQTYEEIGGQKPATTNTIHIDKDRMRIDGGISPDTYMIYRGDKKTFYSVNLKDKTYLETTEKDLEEAKAKIDDAKKKMEEMMAKLPPEQRKSMQAMMDKMLPGGANAPKVVYKKIGAGGIVNGVSTDMYEADQNNLKNMDLWTTPLKNMNVDQDDYQVMKDMAKFYGRFSNNMDWLDQIDKMGLPVKTISYKDGKPHFKTELKEAKKENQPAALFEIPAGLTMKKMMGKPQ
ncbi:MAG: hypothetical protein JWM16_6137 [Verrucomicrobiales bacterium]|nr:hypothetical protein [Verrucomicrobiales bacterium]